MLITNRELLKQYSTEHRIWQGIPSIEVTQGGRIFISFYSGSTGEGLGNYCVLIKSDDDGKTFSEPIAVMFLENHRCFDPCLWIDPLNRLWLIWGKAPNDALYGAICENPDADEIVFGEEFFIGHDVMMNKPTILKNGEWLFPIAVWNYGVYGPINKNFPSAVKPKGSYVYTTNDNGKTFKIKGFADVKDRTYDEHILVELNDGTLRMFVRTKYGIGAADSTDGGATWGEGFDTGYGGPSARFHIRRLPSGNLLLINHYDYTERNNLTAMISDDDGKTWKWKLLLDSRDEVSYPDVSLHDGYIYITYDRERGDYKPSFDEVYSRAREILLAKITEDDIKAGKLVSTGSKLACVASKLGKYYDEESESYNELSVLMKLVNNNEELDKFVEEHKREEIIETIFDKFPVRSYAMSKICPEKLDELITTFENAFDIDKISLRKIFEVLEIAYIYENKDMPISDMVKDIINRSSQKNISIHDIANEIKMSRRYIEYVFKKDTGMTINEYKNGLTM